MIGTACGSDGYAARFRYIHTDTGADGFAARFRYIHTDTGDALIIDLMSCTSQHGIVDYVHIYCSLQLSVSSCYFG
jgi:hypothetical protein